MKNVNKHDFQETLKNWSKWECSKCGSNNIKYEHQFNPMTLTSKVMFTCCNCGHQLII